MLIYDFPLRRLPFAYFRLLPPDCCFRDVIYFRRQTIMLDATRRFAFTDCPRLL